MKNARVRNLKQLTQYDPFFYHTTILGRITKIDCDSSKIEITLGTYDLFKYSSITVIVRIWEDNDDKKINLLRRLFNAKKHKTGITAYGRFIFGSYSKILMDDPEITFLGNALSSIVENSSDEGPCDPYDIPKDNLDNANDEEYYEDDDE